VAIFLSSMMMAGREADKADEPKTKPSEAPRLLLFFGEAF